MKDDGPAPHGDPHSNTGIAPKPVNLALQGGGTHGAFAWGVLDRLLEDGRLAIDAVSATSAGSMNAVVMAYGFSIGGNEGARQKLHQFWSAIAAAGNLYNPARRLPWEQWLRASGLSAEYLPSYVAFQAMTQLFSPYQLNPLNINPLKDVLEQVVDFAHLAQCNKTMRLFLAATNVRTGKIKVFENREMSAKAVLASACLPNVFQAVEIDGEHYWDGGFMGNPAIYPLIYNGRSRDVIIVHIDPMERAELPTTASEIFDRVNEISFNSSLMREMRAIAFVTRLIDQRALDPNIYNRMLIHAIRDDVAMTGLGVASKLDPDWALLCRLRDAGRRATGSWLEASHASIGNTSTIDIVGTYL